MSSSLSTEEDDMEAAKLLICTWLTLVAVWAIMQIWRGTRRTALFCLVVHWVFCGLPLAYDLMWGVPIYNYANMSKASLDPATNTIYLIYISLIPVLIAVAGLGRQIVHLTATQPLPTITTTSGITSIALATALPLPLLVALAGPEPSLYLQYGFIADVGLTLRDDIYVHHGYVTVAGYLAIIAAVGLIATRTSLITTLALTLPWAVLTVFLVGKRYVLALYLALMAQRLWDLGVLSRARLLIYLVAAGLIFGTFNLAYQATIRRINLTQIDPNRAYTGMRLDFGRDNTIKTAIYAEVQGDSIMNYRGESLVFSATFFVPRAWWPDKPLPYGPHMLSYAINTTPRYHGWSFTTSLFDEAIANFGWLGMLIGPLFLGLLCRIADRNEAYWLKTLGVLVCLLFMAVHLAAFTVLFVLWLACSYWQSARSFLTMKRTTPAPLENHE